MRPCSSRRPRAGAARARAGVLAPAQARDAGRAGDRAALLAREPTGGQLEDLDAAVLLAAAPAVVRCLVPVDRLPLGAQARDGLIQPGLVALEPDQEGVAGADGGPEGFFWSCRAPAVNRTPR